MGSFTLKTRVVQVWRVLWINTPTSHSVAVLFETPINQISVLLDCHFNFFCFYYCPSLCFFAPSSWKISSQLATEFLLLLFKKFPKALVDFLSVSILIVSYSCFMVVISIRISLKNVHLPAWSCLFRSPFFRLQIVSRYLVILSCSS